MSPFISYDLRYCWFFILSSSIITVIIIDWKMPRTKSLFFLPQVFDFDMDSIFSTTDVSHYLWTQLFFNTCNYHWHTHLPNKVIIFARDVKYHTSGSVLAVQGKTMYVTVHKILKKENICWWPMIQNKHEVWSDNMLNHSEPGSNESGYDIILALIIASILVTWIS